MDAASRRILGFALSAHHDARASLDRHATYIVATYIAGAAR